MADEIKTEMVEQVATPTEPKVEARVDTPAKASDPETLAELERLRSALKERNKEELARRKKLEELEAKEKEREQAAMTESEKLNARLKELEEANALKDQQLKQTERRELQRKVAKETGLPDGFAERLRGETEDELKADAATVLELLPKQEAEKKQPNAPKLDVTNPGDGKKGETQAQKKARLLGGHVNPWGSEGAADRGGGVIVVTE